MNDVIEQHALEAAYLWEVRDSAARAPHYDLHDLSRLDERVEANLDGLRLAEDEGFAACKANVGEKTIGVCFAAAQIAVDRGDLESLAWVLDQAGKNAVLLRGIEGALAWSSWTQVEHLLPGLFDPACPPALHRLGIAACADHGRDPGSFLDDSVYATDPSLRARAIFAAGQLGRVALVERRRDALSDNVPDVVFAETWALSRGGDPDATAQLLKVAVEGGTLAERARELGFRRADAHQAMRAVDQISRRSPRDSLLAARAAELPDLVPWLLDAMATPELARAAGEAFAHITGLDLASQKLRAPKPEGFKAGPNDDPKDENVAEDPDDNLPWPDPVKLRSYWGRHRASFAPGVRLLLGKPISQSWAMTVLERGLQRQRAAAAIELGLLRPERPLFDVTPPAHQQRAHMGGAR